MLQKVIAYAALATVLPLSASAASNVVVESLPAVPEGWEKIQDADPDSKIRLKVALRQPNLALFEREMYAVSSPLSARYGKHLKREEVRDLMKPDPASTSTVMQWLENAGIPSQAIHEDSDWINIVTSVRNASALLKADFGVYGHANSDLKKIRALEYSVPDNVRDHITMVAPIIRFGEIKPKRSIVKSVEDSKGSIQAAEVPTGQLDVAACNKTITPECLRALYQIGDYKATGSPKSRFGIAGYLEEYARYSELEKFQEVYAPYTLGFNFSVVTINGGLNDQSSTADSVEANLDMQYGVALGYNTNIVYYSTGGRGPLVPDLDQPNGNDSSNEPYLDFLEYMKNLPDDELPQTLTTSYGENEQSVPREFAVKVCNMFGELGARGVSIFFSSGDEGPGSACQSNDGKNTTRFDPAFPAACPYVTAVGGTRYVAPETGAALAGGGFSDIWPQPEWQKTAVEKYLSILGDKWKGLYNPSGRAYPDIAGQAYSCHVFDSGKDVLVAGTSASSPSVAAIFALLNDARLAANQPPMGWINPWLYEVGLKGLTDITVGGSRGCTGKSIYSGLPAPKVPFASWNATEGWDPVTGLGTPLFNKLLELSTPGAQAQKIAN
ncbi:hypothetical protein MCOR02_012551 [Pyricularia oryzae]|nr:hypothetical protein MCOR02_012551 [Pyricularia oryzae]